MTVYTQSGPILTDELSRDAQLIDRKLVRLSVRYRPDWTGVRYKVYVRVTYRVDGELLAFEEHVGDLWQGISDTDLGLMNTQLEELRARLAGLLAELGLEQRGATHE